VQRIVVQTAIRTGDDDLAWATAFSITNGGQRDSLLAELCNAVAAAGRPERARTIAAAISRGAGDSLGASVGTPDRIMGATVEDSGRPPPSLGHVRELIEADDRIGAESVARELADPDVKAMAYTSLATAAIRAGRRDEAGRLTQEAARFAEAVELPHRVARLLAGLAEALAGAHDAAGAHAYADRATQRAVELPSLRRQSAVLATVARAMAVIGDQERCRELSRLVGPPHREQILSAAVGAAATHDPTGAFAIAGFITDLPARAGALAEVAREQRDPGVVRALVAAALRYGSWSHVLSDPAGLPLEVIAAVAAGADPTPAPHGHIPVPRAMHPATVQAARPAADHPARM
jgi:hypothetical protein